ACTRPNEMTFCPLGAVTGATCLAVMYAENAASMADCALAAVGAARVLHLALRWSADRAVAKAMDELRHVRGQMEAAEQVLDMIVGDVEASQRLRALLPAFLALSRGEAPSWLDKLRRNVVRDEVAGQRANLSFSANAAVFVPSGECGLAACDAESVVNSIESSAAASSMGWAGLCEASVSPHHVLHDAGSDTSADALSAALAGIRPAEDANEVESKATGVFEEFDELGACAE
ncbi:unnamed protein product, partial [Prorocentrum cordatum]